MKIADLTQKLEGIYTLESIMETLKVDRSTAMNYVSKLRKQGYVKTKRTSSGKRIYSISRLNKIGGKSYYEVLNQISPIKLSESETYKVYGRDITYEETLVYAIKTGKLRVVLSSLALFKHINNCTQLSELARKDGMQRQACALYELARSTMKVRKMGKKFLKTGLPKAGDTYLYIIPNLESKDFVEIQQKWKVYLPFNKEDLWEYLQK